MPRVRTAAVIRHPGTVELTGRYLVAGGAGVAGECVTAELLRRGATVAVPSRSRERLDRLRSGLAAALRPRLLTILGDVGDPAGVTEVRDRVAGELGPLDGVVASLGAWWEGAPLTEVPYDVWQRILRDNLTAHFLVAQTFLPLLRDRPGGVYVALSGIAALRPIPLSGPISVTDAAQTMLLRVFATELADEPVRIHEIAILTPVVTRHWPQGDPVEPGWLSGDQVGSYVAEVTTPGFPGTDLQLRLPPDFDIWA
jgi:NAD(P)-dependent dehydrogenase (short-subunit alcohol dehydrogenase family)